MQSSCEHKKLHDGTLINLKNIFSFKDNNATEKKQFEVITITQPMHVMLSPNLLSDNKKKILTIQLMLKKK
jgi:hypothetical protein